MDIFIIILFICISFFFLKRIIYNNLKIIKGKKIYSNEHDKSFRYIEGCVKKWPWDKPDKVIIYGEKNKYYFRGLAYWSYDYYLYPSVKKIKYKKWESVIHNNFINLNKKEKQLKLKNKFIEIHNNHKKII